MGEGERTRDCLGARRGNASLSAGAVHSAAESADGVRSLGGGVVIELDAHY